MSKDQIIVDLRRIPLAPHQTKALSRVIHNKVVEMLGEADASVSNSLAEAETDRGNIGASLLIAATATIHVSFMNTIPGRSHLKAILKGNEQEIDHSGDITFHNVNSGDIIMIHSTSLGSATISIDVDADPTIMNFPPGNNADEFFIN
jgi:hypothetical protein